MVFCLLFLKSIAFPGMTHLYYFIIIIIITHPESFSLDTFRKKKKLGLLVQSDLFLC